MYVDIINIYNYEPKLYDNLFNNVLATFDPQNSIKTPRRGFHTFFVDGRR